MPKRIIAVFLLVCMLLGVMPVMAQSEEIDRVLNVVAVSEGSGCVGDTVDVTLDISGNRGFSNLGLEVAYDNTVLTLVAVSENEEVGAIFTAAESIDANPYNVAWDRASDVCFNGRLATFTFKIADDASVGAYPLELSYYKGRNGDYEDGNDVNYDENDVPLNLQYKSGCINVLYEPIIRPDETTDNSYNGNVYMVLDRTVSWSEARKQCEAAGGHLATVTSAKENNFIQSICSKGNSGQYYLGASDSFNNGIWSWIGSESFVYTNWEDNEPGETDDADSYLAMNCENGKWMGTSGDSALKTGFVCEWEGGNTEADSTYWVEFDIRKTVYAIGENFEADVWLYSGDSVMRIYDNDYTVTGFDSSKPGIYNVTVAYEEYSQTFEVEVDDGKEAETVATYVVRSEAGYGTSISPSGYCEVTDGTVMKFVVGVRDGYVIDCVTVNGESVKLTDSNLTVTVDRNTVIEVDGKKKTYSIEASVYGNGNIQLQSDNVEHGNNCTARIVADNGYIVSDVKVDGVSVGACKLYTFSDVKENHTIEAFFEEIVRTYTIRATAGKGGKVYPARSVVNSGGSTKLSVTPDYGYHIDYAVINGETVGINSNEIYVSNITADTDVSIVFEKNKYTVSAGGSEGAQISFEYNGQSLQKCDVSYMSDVTVVIDVEEGYKLNTLYVNNNPVKPKKSGNRLVYDITVYENTVITTRCALTRVSEFSREVAAMGLAADINASNAYSKKEDFTYLANKYTVLSEEEKSICTSAYATVLSALDRANAYIAIIESQITERISQMCSPDKLHSENYRDWKDIVDTACVEYENMTYLAKSLIDIELVNKLSLLKTKIEELTKESKGAVLYLCELIDSVPDTETAIAESLPAAYAKLLLAENTYNSMSEDDKEDVSDEKYNELIEKHGKISTYIQKQYVAPFTSRVLRCSGVMATDSVADAEAKRALIYELMNEYHSFPAFVQEQVALSTVQKLNAIYESASIKVTATVNNLPVDMNGDFTEDVELVITEPELDNSTVADATGKSLYQAIDVKMYSENQEVQPSSKIRVKMEISIELANADVSVVYINDAGEMYDIQGEIIEENSKYYIVFFVDHFSNFAVLYNETETPDMVMSFDVEYAEVGDYVTASVTGLLNSSACTLYVAGYSKEGVLTFAEVGSNNVSAMVAEDTAIVKAMLWDKNMMPLIAPVTLLVSGDDNEDKPSEIAVSFDTQYAEVGDIITATVTGADASECRLFVAGYSESGALTFAKTGNQGVAVATIAKNTVMVKAMLWDKNMVPLITPVTLTVSGNDNEDETADAVVSFNTQYAEVGESITATAKGTGMDVSKCSLFMAGYSENGVLTFAKIGSGGTVSANVAPNTQIVKAMLWNSNMSPVAEAGMLFIN